MQVSLAPGGTVSREIQLAGNVESTAKNYLAHVAHLAEHYQTSPELLSEEQVRKYLVLRRQKLQLTSMRPLAAALKFFFAKTVPRDWETMRALRIPKVRKLPAHHSRRPSRTSR